MLSPDEAQKLRRRHATCHLRVHAFTRTHGDMSYDPAAKDYQATFEPSEDLDDVLVRYGYCLDHQEDLDVEQIHALWPCETFTDQVHDELLRCCRGPVQRNELMQMLEALQYLHPKDWPWLEEQLVGLKLLALTNTKE